jgi:RNA polymerase sigma-32 factor
LIAVKKRGRREPANGRGLIDVKAGRLPCRYRERNKRRRETSMPYSVKRAITVPMTEESLTSYLKAIKKFPLLTPEEEYMLAKRYAEHGDARAAHKLVTSHLRLVAKIAMGYRASNVPLLDLISEGNVGLMRAVKKFEPDKGFRLATYAVWWIKAAINECLVSSWSLVKLGTVAAQRRLFFNLRKVKAKLGIYGAKELSPENARLIADKLCVPVEEVVEMNGRMSQGDSSLNQPAAEDDETQRLDLLVDTRPDQEAVFGETEELSSRVKMLRDALGCLNPRERRIIESRRLSETPRTLEDIGRECGISRERVRQIENAAFDKLQHAMLARSAAWAPTVKAAEAAAALGTERHAQHSIRAH